ncbi:AI-2E family transporter [Halobellus limi]|uniref:AI-2E family transporter n=1 Tax=Halobellus limi TaxID=699433 RepID=A0A4D6GWZ1_9EURY|nr:AI-2E family transporter [Halobellus limi]QCC46269.1 AI-2E family transporter [Halobellus limi]
MTRTRRYALGAVFVLVGAAAALLLQSVLGTVFFAVTVAYLLWPIRRGLVARGLSHRAASGVATLGAFLMAVLVFVPLAVVVYLRFESFVALIGLLPAELHLDVFGFQYAVTLEALTSVVVDVVERSARRAAAAAPVLVLKATLFVFLVYSLLSYGEDAQQAVTALVPPGYHDAAAALNRRTRETLFAIYVLQAATALGTFVLAVPVFFALGYDSVVTLATVSAVLQFVPVVGPSVLLAGLAAYHVAVGELLRAVLVFFVGGLVIALLPDVLIRPRLARETADIPGSLYFVGFFGGVLTLGPIGVVAGPLVVGLFVESAALLSSELHPADRGSAAGGVSEPDGNDGDDATEDDHDTVDGEDTGDGDDREDGEDTGDGDDREDGENTDDHDTVDSDRF